MADETIVAVFDTAEHARAAVRELEETGIPSSAIQQHAGTGLTGAGGTITSSGESLTGAEQQREHGFWSSLFGAEPEYNHDTTVYDRSLQSGSTVVTVRSSGAHYDQVLDVLERHNPIDIDERAAAYGVAHTGSGTLNASTGVAGHAASGITGEPGTLSLSEETITVGKRAINRGTTRVRRYVVETPVEETVSLRDEHVSVERRPVTESRAVTGADFSDKTIEITEMAEEAVVLKQAHVREEVVIRKDVTDRSQTIRDTLRREDVEITKDPAGAAFDGTVGTDPARVGATGAVPAKPGV